MKRCAECLVSSLVFATLPSICSAQASGREIVNAFTIEPVALDSENAEKTSMGIAFDLTGKLFEKEFDANDSGSLELDPNARVGGASVDFTFSGTVTQEASDNPKNLIETKISGNYLSSRGSRSGGQGGSLTMIAGGFVEYEADQDFEDKQLVYGGTVTIGKIDLWVPNDIFSFQANIGEVDPSKDADRQEILGASPENYTRADVEVLYILNIGSANFDTFEINYRYFKELSAPDAIEAAGADTFKLATYRLGFPNKLFLAYSTGKLPFDRTSDQIFELGFSFKLK